jgi:REP element-mobilizing transposase RayT
MSHVNLNYHLIFGTKNHKNLIDTHIRERLYEYIGSIIRDKDGNQMEIGGTGNHIHILASFHQTKNVAGMVRDIKSNSAGWLNETDEYPHQFRWQTKYGAFNVSKSRVPAVAEYIQNQQEHHRAKTFREEFVEFLDRHEIDYDDQYLWE